MPEYLPVSTMAGSRDSALKLLRSAVRERLAKGQAAEARLVTDVAWWLDESPVALSVRRGIGRRLPELSRVLTEKEPGDLRERAGVVMRMASGVASNSLSVPMA